MEYIKVNKGQVIARQKEKVKKWYIIMEGAVIQMNANARIALEKNYVIGMSESDRYLCDYIASQDTVLSVFSFDTPDALIPIIKDDENMRLLLLHAAFRQRQKLLETYAGFGALTRQFHTFVENQYSNYASYCTKYGLEMQSFTRIDSFKPLEMVHKAENWEINNSRSLMNGYLEEYVGLMKKDEGLCIGAIMEASYQSRRVMQGLIEMVEYLQYNKNILLEDSESDLFGLYFDLTIKAERKQLDTAVLHQTMKKISEVVRRLGIYDETLVEKRLKEYEEHDFTADSSNGTESEEVGLDEDCLAHILTYAKMGKEEILEIKADVEAYRTLPDLLATDDQTRLLRRKLTKMFYDVYQRVFMRAMEEEENLTLILRMFLNFGFMDVQMAGEENSKALYELARHLDICNSEHVYTIFTWLKSIYEGQNEPSKNEFDLDYPAHLAEQRKIGDLTAQQVKEYQNRRDMKVIFEIQNMFTTGNRLTYGKISTFCPILCSIDMINSVDKMLLTAKKIEESMNKIRKVDYSVFYREVLFSDPDKGINSEMIMKEVLPDVILMPNAGTRAMMWQEIAGVKRDTSARYMISLFTVVDIDEMMIEITGRYRWEICRRIQGVRWNDIRERSLTSEYCDYIQFYRKNRDLSTEAKEKLKNALQQSKNNYREVFVKDYQNWIKYESKGSFRLNKVAREILVNYCIFSKAIRNELSANPMYQNLLSKHDLQTAKKAQRIMGIYDKYKKAGGVITKELEDNLEYYQM